MSILRLVSNMACMHACHPSYSCQSGNTKGGQPRQPRLCFNNYRIQLMRHMSLSDKLPPPGPGNQATFFRGDPCDDVRVRSHGRPQLEDLCRRNQYSLPHGIQCGFECISSLYPLVLLSSLNPMISSAVSYSHHVVPNIQDWCSQ